MKFGQQYPYCFPLWFGPFVCFLNIHHPEYVKTILASTGAHYGTLLFQHIKYKTKNDWIIVHVIQSIFHLIPTEPKDDLAYSFIQNWIGKTVFFLLHHIVTECFLLLLVYSVTHC